MTLFTALTLVLLLLAAALPLVVLARWVHSDNPGRPPGRTD